MRWQTSSLFDNKIGSESNSQDSLRLPDLYLSPQNAARYLDVSVKFIYERIQSGEIACQAVGNRIKRIRKGVLDEWLSAQAERQKR